ncbi:hypothetical protein KJ665_03425 [Patescibacteria group bacterium]|nr:hypothetical protein [Patescibacteria group bacterium]
MNIVKQNEIADEVLSLTNPDQKKRMLKDCLLLYNTRALKWTVRLRLDFEEKQNKLKELLKDPKREDKIIALSNAEQIINMLKDCLCGLSSPEFKKLLYIYVREIPVFNRLIREAGGRTVVPYEVD